MWIIIKSSYENNWIELRIEFEVDNNIHIYNYGIVFFLMAKRQLTNIPMTINAHYSSSNLFVKNCSYDISHKSTSYFHGKLHEDNFANNTIRSFVYRDQEKCDELYDVLIHILYYHTV